MKKDIHYILDVLREVSPFINDNFSVNTIEVFGSFVRNKQHKKSDVDILVTFIKTPSLLKFIELENFLSDKLGMKVDLVMKNSLKPRFKKSILNNSIPV